MNIHQLKKLLDIILNKEEDEEDIRAQFIAEGEDPDAIIERALKFVKEKKAEIIIKSLESRKN